MEKYIPQAEFDKHYLSIKKIKDTLEAGTSICFKNGDFFQLLLVESGILSLSYFNSKILGSSFDNFARHGGLRENKEKQYYTRANANVIKQLNTINSEYQDALFSKLNRAIHANVLPLIKKNILHDNDNNIDQYDDYIIGLYGRFLTIVTQANTYYDELYDSIIQMLENQEKIEQVLSLLCLIAIYQDDIYVLFPDKYRTPWSNDGFFPFQPKIKPLLDEVEDEVQGDPIPFTTNELFEAALSGTTELGKIVAVDMCFHGGALWRTDGTKDRLLKKAINTGAKIRVIVNTTARVQEICSHMKQPDLEYVGFEKNLENWVKLMLKHPESVEIHIATVPLLRRSYIIRGEKSKGWANITYYSYGHVIDECQRVNYRSGCQEYKLYFDEFEYIWNNASEIYSETLLTISKPKRNDGFNETDEDNIAFVRKALENQECQAFDIISVLAYYCAIGRVRELIKSRLSDDSNFVLRMILPDPKNGENLEKWFLGFDKETMTIIEFDTEDVITTSPVGNGGTMPDDGLYWSPLTPVN